LLPVEEILSYGTFFVCFVKLHQANASCYIK